MRKVLEVFSKHLKINYQENNFIFENMFSRSSQTKRAHQILKVILYNSSLSIKIIVKESFPQNFFIQISFLVMKNVFTKAKNN
jgi:hypothetical protein